MKFKAAADAYPRRTPASSRAIRRPDADGAWQCGRGRPTYQQVIDRAGDRIYGQMARLGLAEAQARSGQFDQAINTFKELAQRKDGPLPVDGILMQLGRAYRDAGRAARPADLQSPDRGVSRFAVQHGREKELEALKKTKARLPNRYANIL